MSRLTNPQLKQENIKKIKTITCTGLFINLFLSAFKLLVGFYGNSQAVIADGVHSLSDTATDIAILLGVKYWSAPPDQKHPYGHLRIETMITAMISLFLIAIAIGIGYDAIVTMHNLDEVPPLGIALTAPFISIIAKEILYRWNIGVGKKIKSSALIANAWHHRSDVFSSIVAFLAVLAGLINPSLSFVDNIGALVVALFILKVAWDIIVPAVSEFIDSGSSEKIQKLIMITVIGVKGVKATHAIRTRKTGSCLLVDLHVLVDQNMSVKDSHIITEKIQNKLTEKIPEIIDVTVHIEPYTKIELNRGLEEKPMS